MSGAEKKPLGEVGWYKDEVEQKGVAAFYHLPGQETVWLGLLWKHLSSLPYSSL